jgi:hypothetical protein
MILCLSSHHTRSSLHVFIIINIHDKQKGEFYVSFTKVRHLKNNYIMYYGDGSHSNRAS